MIRATANTTALRKINVLPSAQVAASGDVLEHGRERHVPVRSTSSCCNKINAVKYAFHDVVSDSEGQKLLPFCNGAFRSNRGGAHKMGCCLPIYSDYQQFVCPCSNLPC